MKLSETIAHREVEGEIIDKDALKNITILKQVVIFTKKVWNAVFRYFK